MSAIDQQLSTKPIPAEPQVIADALNREIVPVLRRVRAVLNQRLDIAAVEFGDGVATTFDVTHPLGTLDVMAVAYDPATGLDLAFSTPLERLDADTLRVTFAAPPPAGSRLLVRA